MKSKKQIVMSKAVNLKPVDIDVLDIEPEVREEMEGIIDSEIVDFRDYLSEIERQGKLHVNYYGGDTLYIDFYDVCVVDLIEARINEFNDRLVDLADVAQYLFNEEDTDNE